MSYYVDWLVLMRPNRNSGWVEGTDEACKLVKQLSEKHLELIEPRAELERSGERPAYWLINEVANEPTKYLYGHFTVSASNNYAKGDDLLEALLPWLRDMYDEGLIRCPVEVLTLPEHAEQDWTGWKWYRKWMGDTEKVFSWWASPTDLRDETSFRRRAYDE